jgi:hypothetical protein
MKGHWEFNKADPSSVRVDVTQRDQFNNDEVGLAEALVREVIQNSSDAPSGSTAVKVRFATRELAGRDAQTLQQLLQPLEPHLAACGIDAKPLSGSTVRLLTIEDFNTSGLTGRRDEVDGGNFDSFWRAVGKSGKSGNELGRWGLGKLVYSSASGLRVFFGLSISADHPTPAIMGQAVLKNHRLGSTFHPSHGFWFDGRSSNGLQLQQPVQDGETIAEFIRIAGLSRRDQSGLSLVIPHLLDGIDDRTLIAGVVSNYYFPILAGRLVVEVGDVLIDRETFLDVAAQQDLADRIPFDFVKAISDTIDRTPAISVRRAITGSTLAETSFHPEDIAVLKEQFAAGELVHIRVPVLLKPQGSTDSLSHFDLYLRALPEGQRPFALFARQSITLPGERRFFSGAAAYGALIARDAGVAGFLGDAENPAHTAWNTQAEKLASWRSPQNTLSAIRNSLKALYGLIAEQAETEDDEALIDFFSVLEKTVTRAGKKKKTPKVRIDVTPREKAISIRERKGGFGIVAGPAAASWNFPRSIRVRMAYDMIGANPFNRHSRFDFDLEKGHEIDIETTNATYEVIKPNILRVIAEGPDFAVEVSGFDEHRDIVVDARAQ